MTGRCQQRAHLQGASHRISSIGLWGCAAPARARRWEPVVVSAAGYRPAAGRARPTWYAYATLTYSGEIVPFSSGINPGPRAYVSSVGLTKAAPASLLIPVRLGPPLTPQNSTGTAIKPIRPDGLSASGDLERPVARLKPSFPRVADCVGCHSVPHADLRTLLGRPSEFALGFMLTASGHSYCGGARCLCGSSAVALTTYT